MKGEKEKQEERRQQKQPGGRSGRGLGAGEKRKSTRRR